MKTTITNANTQPAKMDRRMTASQHVVFSAIVSLHAKNRATMQKSGVNTGNKGDK